MVELMRRGAGTLEQFVDRCGVNHELALVFLLGFSRLEYALKRTGYARKGKQDKVEISWRQFASDTGPLLDAEKTPTVLESMKYLQDYPPLMERVTAELVPEWREDDARARGPGERALLRVKTVRNNFFHGAKYPYRPDRDGPLLRHSLVIFEESLRVREDIRAYFDIPDMRDGG